MPDPYQLAGLRRGTTALLQQCSGQARSRSFDPDGERQPAEPRVGRQRPDAMRYVRGNPDQITLTDFGGLDRPGHWSDVALARRCAWGRGCPSLPGGRVGTLRMARMSTGFGRRTSVRVPLSASPLVKNATWPPMTTRRKAGETVPASPEVSGSSGSAVAATRMERLRSTAQHTRAVIEARRADSASIDTAFEAVERDAQSGGGVLAAAVAFRLFMFLVPYAFVMVTGFGLASTAASQSPKDAAESAGISGLLASAVTSTSTMSLANRIVALVLGGITLAFTARSLIRVLWIVHRLIWGVRPSRGPSLWAALILVGIVTVLFGLADLVAWLGSQSIGLRLVGLLLTVVASAGAWYLASWWMPREDCEMVGAPPGSRHGRPGCRSAAPAHAHLRRARGVAEILPLWCDRDRARRCCSGPISPVDCSPLQLPPMHRCGSAGRPRRPWNPRTRSATRPRGRRPGPGRRSNRPPSSRSGPRCLGGSTPRWRPSGPGAARAMPLVPPLLTQ